MTVLGPPQRVPEAGAAAAPGGEEALVRAHGAGVLAATLRLLEREDEALDAAGRTFAAAFRSLERPRAEGDVARWLHVLAVSVCLPMLAARCAAAERPIEPWLPAFDATGHHARRIASWDTARESRLAPAEVRRAIEELPRHYRDVLLSRDGEGLSTAETARALGVSPGEVGARLHRARQALRAKLGGLLALPRA